MSEFVLGPIQLRWVKALESGFYGKCVGRLYNTADRYCCLGVARQILNIEKQDGLSAVLTFKEADALGLKDPRGKGSDKDGKATPSLANMNDSGSTFSEIAAHLREHPEWYFREPR